MPQNAFFLQTRDLLVSQKMMQKPFFSTLHPLSMVIFATATVLAFVLLHNSRFNFHCYTQCEAMPTQKSAQKWCCDLSWLLARKITKGIHLCKPASLNCPIQWWTCHKQFKNPNRLKCAALTVWKFCQTGWAEWSIYSYIICCPVWPFDCPVFHATWTRSLNVT